ncbi:MAG TPA: hypothetical protein VFG63_08565 [Nocardioidaceae bacterium]|nr:hypothetical protein [Nocardioidaceae bacterium]
MTNWGATQQEAEESLPGDEVVGQSKYRSTRAVTVNAPVELVWPWLVQLGQGRGGLYSYDWLENLLGLDIHSADRIVPDYQHLAVGDLVRLVPEGTQPPLRFTVKQVEPPRLLVLGPAGPREEAFTARMPFPCWTFRLTPMPGHRTRLVVRFQSDFEPNLIGWVAYKYALAPVHFVMERKMLLGIKRLAERMQRTDQIAGLGSGPGAG